MDLYFTYGDNEYPISNPPLAIDVAKALIVISQDNSNNFGGDVYGPTDWLEEISDHLRAHARTMRMHIAREERNRKNGY